MKDAQKQGPFKKYVTLLGGREVKENSDKEWQRGGGSSHTVLLPLINFQEKFSWEKNLTNLQTVDVHSNTHVMWKHLTCLTFIICFYIFLIIRLVMSKSYLKFRVWNFSPLWQFSKLLILYDKFQLPNFVLSEFFFVEQQNILHCEVEMIIILRKVIFLYLDELVIFFLNLTWTLYFPSILL